MRTVALLEAALVGSLACSLVAVGLATLRGWVTPYRDYEPYAPDDEAGARRTLGWLLVATGTVVGAMFGLLTGAVPVPSGTAFPASMGVVGLYLLAFGALLGQGRAYLLAVNLTFVSTAVQDGVDVDDEARARRTGGAFVGLGLVCLGVGAAVATGVASASSLPLLIGWVVATALLVGAAIAASLGMV